MLRLLRKPKTYNHVFIFTYGRSGSTLLMGLLNSLPRYCIRGENNNLLYHIYQTVAALSAAQASPSAKNAARTTHPWFGLQSANPEALAKRLISAFVEEVLAPQTGVRTVGFKEIRFSKEEMPDFEGYVAFIRANFPGGKIICNHRDLDDVAASKWWSTMPTAREKLQVMEDRFNSLDSGLDTFHFHYDRIDDSLSHIRELFVFLGEQFDEVTVRQVLSVKHSY